MIYLSIEYYPATRIKYLQLHAITCINLTNVMLRERSQSKTRTYDFISFSQFTKTGKSKNTVEVRIVVTFVGLVVIERDLKGVTGKF